MAETDNLRDFNSLSELGKEIFTLVKMSNPNLSEEQQWKAFEVRKESIRKTMSQSKKVYVASYNNSTGRSKEKDSCNNSTGRSKVKDAIMKTIIYGGGFVAEAIASAALTALCAAVGNPHAHQMWLGSKNARKEHKDKAWNAYCKTGDMLDGFSELIDLEN